MARIYKKRSSFILSAGEAISLRDFIRQKIPGIAASAIADVMIGRVKKADGSEDIVMTVLEKVTPADLSAVPDGVSLETE